MKDLTTGQLIVEGIKAGSFREAVKGIVNLHPEAPGPFAVWNRMFCGDRQQVKRHRQQPRTEGVTLLQGTLRSPLYGVSIRERNTGTIGYLMVRVGKYFDWDSGIRSAFYQAPKKGFALPLDVLKVEGYQYSRKQFVAVRGGGPRAVADHLLDDVEVRLELPLCKPGAYDGLKPATGCDEGGATA